MHEYFTGRVIFALHDACDAKYHLDQSTLICPFQMKNVEENRVFVLTWKEFFRRKNFVWGISPFLLTRTMLRARFLSFYKRILPVIRLIFLIYKGIDKCVYTKLIAIYVVYSFILVNMPIL